MQTFPDTPARTLKCTAGQTSRNRFVHGSTDDGGAERVRRSSLTLQVNFDTDSATIPGDAGSDYAIANRAGNLGERCNGNSKAEQEFGLFSGPLPGHAAPRGGRETPNHT